MPLRRLCVLASTLMLLIPGFATADDSGAVLTPDFITNLRDLIPSFVRDGITLARPTTGQGHAAHFIASDSPQLLALQRLNEDLGSQLSSFPLSSSAGGFTYEFDPALGVFTRSTDSFGPIYAERATTIGQGRFNLGLSFSHYTFDQVDDLNLRDGDLNLVFSHEDTNQDGSQLTQFFEGDLITSKLFLKMETSITAFLASYGVTDRIDVGVAIPLVQVDLAASVQARVQRVSTGPDSPIHQFENGTDEDSFTESGSATGLGDVILRAKARLSDDPKGGFAVAADVRAPTGEERDLLGSGAWQAKAMLIGSWTRNRVTPHVNVGYAYNSSDLSDEFTHSVGLDVAVGSRVTLAADLLGRFFLDTPKVGLKNKTFEGADENNNVQQAVFPVLDVEEAETRYAAAGAFGAKINLVGNALLSLNGLIAFTTDGLIDSFTPLIGIDYSF